MFLLDNLFTWPLTGLHWVVKELQQAASEERAAEAEGIRGDLRDLYLQLESGAINEEEFDEREGPLLDRLDAAEEALRNEAAGDEDDDDDDDDDDDEGDDDSEEEESDEEEDGDVEEVDDVETAVPDREVQP